MKYAFIYLWTLKSWSQRTPAYKKHKVYLFWYTKQFVKVLCLIVLFVSKHNPQEMYYYFITNVCKMSSLQYCGTI